MALLREKLKPVTEVEAAKLDALFSRLDGTDFNDREAATQELVALADAAEPRLRASREASSLEVRRRAEAALNRIEAGRIRSERAVEVLEMIGDAAARKLLGELAAGMRGAARTADAAGAVATMAPTPRRAASALRRSNVFRLVILSLQTLIQAPQGEKTETTRRAFRASSR